MHCHCDGLSRVKADLLEECAGRWSSGLAGVELREFELWLLSELELVSSWSLAGGGLLGVCCLLESSLPSPTPSPPLFFQVSTLNLLTLFNSQCLYTQ